MPHVCQSLLTILCWHGKYTFALSPLSLWLLGRSRYYGGNSLADPPQPTSTWTSSALGPRPPVRPSSMWSTRLRAAPRLARLAVTVHLSMGLNLTLIGWMLGCWIGWIVVADADYRAHGPHQWKMMKTAIWFIAMAMSCKTDVREYQHTPKVAVILA